MLWLLELLGKVLGTGESLQWIITFVWHLNEDDKAVQNGCIVQPAL